MSKEDKTLVAMQKKLLPMFQWFHEFCEENNLRYYALGGTMLGAVRHKGFIPWDDDIDVGMPRNDYLKFLKLCKGKSFGSYIVESIDDNKKDFFYGYAKIYDKSTTLIEHSRYNVRRGIFIDLFPLDGAGNSWEEALKICKPVYWKYQLLMSRTCAFNSKRSWYKNAALFLCRCFPKRILDDHKLQKKIDTLCQKYNYDNCDYVANMMGNWGSREIVRRRVMGIPCLYEFEGMQIYGAEKYDEYLTSLYGDWRKLPPKDKQITHHDYVELNLHKPY